MIQRNNVLDHTNEYVLGTIFMFNYYVIFDFENQQIGFNGRTIDLTPEVDPTKPSGFPWLIILLVAGGLALIGILVFVCIRMKNKKLDDKLKTQGYETL